MSKSDYSFSDFFGARLRLHYALQGTNMIEPPPAAQPPLIVLDENGTFYGSYERGWDGEYVRNRQGRRIGFRNLVIETSKKASKKASKKKATKNPTEEMEEKLVEILYSIETYEVHDHPQLGITLRSSNEVMYFIVAGPEDKNLVDRRMESRIETREAERRDKERRRATRSKSFFNNESREPSSSKVRFDEPTDKQRSLKRAESVSRVLREIDDIKRTESSRHVGASRRRSTTLAAMLEADQAQHEESNASSKRRSIKLDILKHTHQDAHYKSSPALMSGDGDRKQRRRSTRFEIDIHLEDKEEHPSSREPDGAGWISSESSKDNIPRAQSDGSVKYDPEVYATAEDEPSDDEGVKAVLESVLSRLRRKASSPSPSSSSAPSETKEERRSRHRTSTRLNPPPNEKPKREEHNQKKWGFSLKRLVKSKSTV